LKTWMKGIRKSFILKSSNKKGNLYQVALSP
jgi:hypothetical protein